MDSKQFNQWSNHIDQSKKQLESKLEKWKQFSKDYSDLATTLDTLPDQCSRPAMIPFGKLAFMPGKLIHTNEILVHLGDQYYAERSAKQAKEMAMARQQVVDEHYRIMEAQYNALLAKSTSAKDILFPSNESLNDEGLPIMEIREPLDSDQQPTLIPVGGDPASIRQIPVPSPPQQDQCIEQPPLTPPPKATASNAADDDHQRLMAMLDDLEREEEAEMRQQEQDLMEEQLSFYESPVTPAKHGKDQSDDDDDDAQYDTALADDLFDDDEEYATQGIVDEEDLTVHDDRDEQKDMAQPPATSSLLSDELDPALARSVPKLKSALQTSVKECLQEVPAVQVPASPATQQTPPTKPKVSRFKQQMMEKGLPDDATVPSKKPVFKVNVEAARQRRAQRQQHQPPVIASIPTPPSEPVPAPSHTIPEPEGPPAEKKKTSRFKQFQEQQRMRTTNTTPKSTVHPTRLQKASAVPIDEPTNKLPSKPSLPMESATPQRKTVTWDTTTNVREHGYHSAPLDEPHDTYEAPMKKEATAPSPQRSFSSPSDIVNAILSTQSFEVEDDGFPGLPLETNGPTLVDLNDLIRDLPSSEPLYTPSNDDDMFIRHTMPTEAPAVPTMPPALLKPRSNMDSNVMRGAVLERDTESPDLDQVEDDMDLREIKAKYQQQRISMLAAMGKLSAEPKSSDLEVFDDELPLPSNEKKKDEKEQEAEQPEEKPRKISRFKATRLNAAASTQDQYPTY
ncbi:hypothetical protein DM01DRAFT_1331445 [Hesseltinella vesiculosa]|uniref:DUF3835 domain-containing protein n=1 Tax=Hesseltinella vesiculosa TaxID=101127 RepID=A0A1X2GWH9_9FUNG|nr:hypothetical protein DM01DRAFT_1331445 [Hesseltinella vesiculosa]